MSGSNCVSLCISSKDVSGKFGELKIGFSVQKMACC